jgi:hypothetical protein
MNHPYKIYRKLPDIPCKMVGLNSEKFEEVHQRNIKAMTERDRKCISPELYKRIFLTMQS